MISDKICLPSLPLLPPMRSWLLAVGCWTSAASQTVLVVSTPEAKEALPSEGSESKCQDLTVTALVCVYVCVCVCVCVWERQRERERERKHMHCRRRQRKEWQPLWGKLSSKVKGSPTRNFIPSCRVALCTLCLCSLFLQTIHTAATSPS